MKKLALSVILSSAVATSAFAIPGIDLKLGVGYTSLDPSGYVSYGGDSADLDKDLNWGKSNYVNGYVELGLPVIPNIRVEYLPTIFDGTGTVTKNITFGGVNINVNDRVYSKFNVKQYDLILYYNLPIPVIKPKLGLAAKYLDGYIYLKSLTTNNEETVDLNIPVPLVFAGFNIGLPVVPIEIDLEGKGIAYQGSYIIDAKATGKLVFGKIPLLGKAYIGGGYRYQRYRLKDIDIDGKKLNTDIKFAGPFAELGVQF